MIARTWRGVTRAEDADVYLDYLNATGLREYRETPGNLGVLTLRQVKAGHAEFLLISLWESMDAVRRFAGDDPERAVYYPEDDKFLVERGERIEHFEVVQQTEGAPS